MLLITIMNCIEYGKEKPLTSTNNELFKSNAYGQSTRGENSNHCANVGNWSFQGIRKVAPGNQITWVAVRGFARAMRWGWGQGVRTKETRRLMASSLESKRTEGMKRWLEGREGTWKGRRRGEERNRGLKWFFSNSFHSAFSIGLI